MKTLCNLLGKKVYLLIITGTTKKPEKPVHQNVTYRCKIIYVRILNGSLLVLI